MSVVLNLSRSQLVDSDMEQLASDLQTSQHSNVEQLDLSSNSLSDYGIEVLANAMSAQTKLTKLLLAYNGGLTAQCVVTLLQKCTSLQSLSLRGCRQVGRQFDAIVAPQLANNTSLQSIDISFATPASGINSLIDVLHTNHTLNSVDFSNNSFGDATLTALAWLLVDNRSLTSLNALDYGGTTADGVRQLLHALRLNSSLLEVHLPDLPSNAAVVDEFVGVLASNTTLRSIQFDSRAEWTQQQYVALFDALAKSPSIVQFEKFAGHAVGLEQLATQSFVNLVRQNTVLCRLRFGAVFSDDVPVVDALENNHKLVDVRLAHAGLIESVCRMVSERNRTK